MLTAYKNSVRIENKVDRGAIDNSTFGRRQPVKEWKGDIAEGLRRTRRVAGPGHNMFWTPARLLAEALLMTTQTVFFGCIDRDATFLLQNIG